MVNNILVMDGTYLKGLKHVNSYLNPVLLEYLGVITITVFLDFAIWYQTCLVILSIWTSLM